MRAVQDLQRTEDRDITKERVEVRIQEKTLIECGELRGPVSVHHTHCLQACVGGLGFGQR